MFVNSYIPIVDFSIIAYTFWGSVTKFTQNISGELNFYSHVAIPFISDSFFLPQRLFDWHIICLSIDLSSTIILVVIGLVYLFLLFFFTFDLSMYSYSGCFCLIHFVIYNLTVKSIEFIVITITDKSGFISTISFRATSLEFTIVFFFFPSSSCYLLVWLNFFSLLQCSNTTYLDVEFIFDVSFWRYPEDAHLSLSWEFLSVFCLNIAFLPFSLFLEL